MPVLQHEPSPLVALQVVGPLEEPPLHDGLPVLRVVRFGGGDGGVVAHCGGPDVVTSTQTNTQYVTDTSSIFYNCSQEQQVFFD